MNKEILASSKLAHQVFAKVNAQCDVSGNCDFNDIRRSKEARFCVPEGAEHRVAVSNDAHLSKRETMESRNFEDVQTIYSTHQPKNLKLCRAYRCNLSSVSIVMSRALSPP